MAKAPKVAIVHDWLVGGGAERVVQALHEMYPDAPIYTAFATKEWRDKLDGKVVTGYLQHLGFMRRAIPFLITHWFSHLNLSGYDLVISSSGNGGAKAVRVPEGTTHVCYCHAPTHYYWRHSKQYLENPGFGVLNPLARVVLRVLLKPLRAADLKASKRPDYYIANSTHTASEIKTYYDRESVVVTPPVDIARFKTTQPNQRHGFVTAGRLVPYKHVDIIVKACNALGLPLTVIGRGPALSSLQALAGPQVAILTDVSDQEMPELLASAEAFIFAAYEDFGITPVEAMACGTPVIAYQKGGALDYVVEGKSGAFFSQQSVKSLMQTIKDFKPGAYDPKAIIKHAEQFSTPQFKASFSHALKQLLGE